MKTLTNKRIHLFAFFLVAATGLIGYRLFVVALVRHEAFAKTAKQQQAGATLVLADRGSVYVSDTSHGDKQLVAAVQRSKTGVERIYPRGFFAGQVLGFVGFDGVQRVGQYGIEGSHETELAGNLRHGGDDIVLTLDENIQSYAELTLGALLKKWSSPSGTIVVEDPITGAILAMASSPSFDPNHYADYSLDVFLNPAIQQQFEPGSSFKPITMAAALDTGAVTPDTTYNDTGAVEIAGYTIKNFNEQANGIQTMRQVLEHSLNTGAMFAQRKTGDDKFLNYVVGFGFGQKTGVDLAGEAAGTVANLYTGRAINFATASFGQGIAVTPLQLVNAYAAIANGGKLMKPYVVKEVIHPDGTSTVTKPTILGMPISEKTSTQLRSMLVGVVDKGFDKARIKGYDVAGKTGTAQIPDLSRDKADKEGGYLENKQFIHDFVGFAPAYAPRFVILIKMDRPQGITFAADSLSPVFGDMAQFLIRYFKIPPTR